MTWWKIYYCFYLFIYFSFFERESESKKYHNSCPNENFFAIYKHKLIMYYFCSFAVLLYISLYHYIVLTADKIFKFLLLSLRGLRLFLYQTIERNSFIKKVTQDSIWIWEIFCETIFTLLYNNFTRVKIVSSSYLVLVLFIITIIFKFYFSFQAILL